MLCQNLPALNFDLKCKFGLHPEKNPLQFLMMSPLDLKVG